MRNRNKEKIKKPVMLMILDGYGYNKNDYGNAITKANTPNIDRIWDEYPSTLAIASGNEVGLPEGQMGNSEVGHTNIGAGRVVYQSLSLVNKEIETKEFFSNKVLLDSIEHSKKNNSNIHLLGLVSDGGVHSSNAHLYALIDLVVDMKVDDKTFIHVITDGRDVGPKTAVSYIDELNKKLEGTKVKIATITGRYYTLDRDKRWERVQKSYDTIVNGKGNKFLDATDYINEQYTSGKTDEFIEPSYNQNVNVFIESNDSVIFYNFRPDRAREISHLLIGSESFEYKVEGKALENINLSSMRKYLGIDSNVIYPNEQMKNTIGEVLFNNGVSQIRTAETEKYPHVTFFIDGGIKEFDYSNEKKILVPSPKVATYDLKPDMSAHELTGKLLEQIEDYDSVILNFANPDMVGHTGNFDAVVKSVEEVDSCVGEIYDTFVKKLGGIIMIVADHGNADEMLYEDGSPLTKHTTNPVPVIITDKSVAFKDIFLDLDNPKAKLADFAPTMLKLLNVDIPAEMTGNILVK